MAQEAKQVICFRVRYRHPQHGLMQTDFVGIDNDAIVLETPALKIHHPEWIGRNFVTLSHEWYRELKELTCTLVDPAIIGQDADPTTDGTATGG